MYADNSRINELAMLEAQQQELMSRVGELRRQAMAAQGPLLVRFGHRAGQAEQGQQPPHGIPGMAQAVQGLLNSSGERLFVGSDALVPDQHAFLQAGQVYIDPRVADKRVSMMMVWAAVVMILEMAAKI